MNGITRIFSAFCLTTVFALLLSGCAITVGQKQATQKDEVSKIKPGASTKEDVKLLLGEPAHITRITGSNPGERWAYVYSKMKMFKEEGETHVIEIGFDKKGLTEYLTLKKMTHKSKVFGRKIDVSLWNAIIEGKTTETEIIELLGEPESVTIKSDGSKDFSYTYLKTIESGGLFAKIRQEMETCEITFDGKGIVSMTNRSTGKSHQ